MTKKRTRIILFVTLIFIILLAIPSYFWTKSNIKELNAFYNSKLSPVIMIQEVQPQRIDLILW